FGDGLFMIRFGRGDHDLEGLDGLDGVLQGKAREGGADRAASHDDEGCGLDQGVEMAALQNHADQDQAYGDDRTKNCRYIHGLIPIVCAPVRIPGSLSHYTRAEATFLRPGESRLFRGARADFESNLQRNRLIATFRRMSAERGELALPILAHEREIAAALENHGALI